MTMPDLSVFERPKKCGFARWIETTLCDADKALLEVAWESHYSAFAIHEWLEERGVPTTLQSTWRHRVGRCPCRPRRAELKDAA